MNCTAFLLMYSALYQRVMPTWLKRVASQQTLESEIGSLPEPVFLERLDSILRTAGSETTDRGKGFSHYLVEL